jgi:hypothetical protein
MPRSTADSTYRSTRDPRVRVPACGDFQTLLPTGKIKSVPQGYGDVRTDGAPMNTYSVAKSYAY